MFGKLEVGSYVRKTGRGELSRYTAKGRCLPLRRKVASYGGKCRRMPNRTLPPSSVTKGLTTLGYAKA